MQKRQTYKYNKVLQVCNTIVCMDYRANGKRRKVFEPNNDWIGEATDQEDTVVAAWLKCKGDVMA